MSEAAHSPDFAPATSGACPDMKTKPFATTQWEYGPTGFGWFGSSGTSFIFTRDCGGTQKHCDTLHWGHRRRFPRAVRKSPGDRRTPGSMDARVYEIGTLFSGKIVSYGSHG